MVESLRTKLLLWYTLIIALIVLTFAVAVCYGFWRSLVGDVDRDLQTIAFVLAEGLRPSESGGVDLELSRQYREFIGRSPRTYYALLNERGQLIDWSDPDVRVPERTSPGVQNRAGRRELRLTAVNGAVVLVGQDMREARGRVLALAEQVAATGVAVLLLSLAGGWFLTARALAPAARISRAATAMARGDLSARIPIKGTENEFEHLAAVLNEAFDRLRLAADVQRRFAADASHELRTPLATLAAEFDWALSRERPGASYRECIETCRRASDRMRRIVDDLLTLARSDSDAVLIRREPVELSAAVREAVAFLRSFAEKRGVTIATRLETAWISGDLNQMVQLISNLLKNAIEYNRDQGRVTIDLRARAREAQLSVADTGIGIAADDLPHVFDRFFRADKARSGNGAGSGLGLAISKRIVEAHAGDIACQSTLGEGTTLNVRLPLIEPGSIKRS